MHWGHATSRDMVHWQNLPIALFPDRLGAIFSGSAVLDTANTTGFGSRGKPPLVAMFTYHDHLAENMGGTGYQSQGLAYSLDGGAEWTKFAGNPVLTRPDVKDFRDPKVFWHAATRRWVVALATGDHVAFYSSRNLRQWVHESDFGATLGAHGGVWECPDLIRMTVEGTAEVKYALLVSINPGAPNGGSATQYFIGSFDGHRFVPDVAPAEHSAADARWIDYGTDDYAGSTWSGGPPGDQRVMFIGWMNNWTYGNEVPTTRWRSAMTLPRELRMVRTPQGLELRSSPASELAALRRHAGTVAATHVSGDLDLLHAAAVSPGLLELDLDLDMAGAQQASLVLSNARGEQVVLHVDRGSHSLTLDRARSGTVGFNTAFSAPQAGPLAGDSGRIHLQVFLDTSSIEVFANGGATVMTAVLFPTASYDSIVLHADHELGSVSGTIHELASAWN
jgi:fructan beta-fructosidase